MAAPKIRRKFQLLRELQATLDPEDYLQDVLGVTDYDASREWITFSCPLPFGLHAHGDASPSAGLNKESLGFNCFTCGGGDIIWLTQTVLELSSEDAVREIKGIARSRRDESADEYLASLKKLWVEEDISLVMPTPSAKVVEQWARPFRYFTDRGVTVEVQERMRTGFDPQNRDQVPPRRDAEWFDIPRVVIPHFFTGKLVGWSKRVVSDDLPKQVAKYKHSPAFPKSFTLYNYDGIDKDGPVVVVESPMSVLVMLSIGFDNVVATFGKSVTDEQAALIRGFDEVTVFFDFDWAGQSALASLVNQLSRFTRAFGVIGDPEMRTDPGDYARQGREALLSVLATRTPAALIPEEEWDGRFQEVRRSREDRREASGART